MSLVVFEVSEGESCLSLVGTHCALAVCGGDGPGERGLKGLGLESMGRSCFVEHGMDGDSRARMLCLGHAQGSLISVGE